MSFVITFAKLSLSLSLVLFTLFLYYSFLTVIIFLFTCLSFHHFLLHHFHLEFKVGNSLLRLHTFATKQLATLRDTIVVLLQMLQTARELMGKNFANPSRVDTVILIAVVKVAYFF